MLLAVFWSMCFCQQVLHWALERRREPSRAGVAQEGRMVWPRLRWMKSSWVHFLPNAVCICRSTNSATLGNKVAHCLLYQLSQHQDICHRIWSPAVLCYWKHSTNMIQQTTTWLVWSTQYRGKRDLHHFVTTCLAYSGCQDRVLSWADQTSRVEYIPKRWNSSSPTLRTVISTLDE